jgi:pimeloyl-ACP methyl ester carboxylesterase
MLAFLAAVTAMQAADFTDFLVLDRAGQGGRSIIQRDALLARLAEGWSDMPKEGDSIPWGDTKVTWRKASVDKDGWLKDRSMTGGWAAAEVEWDGKAPFVLKCVGASQMWVNGLPYAGDVYGTGTLLLPIQVKKGKNVFLFKGGRGQLHAERVTDVKPGLNFGLENTLPDEVGMRRLLGSVAVYNSSETRFQTSNPLRGQSPTFDIAPYGVRRMAWEFTQNQEGRLLAAGQSEVRVPTTVKKPTEVHKRTFFSEIDGSVQYYGVNPSTNPTPGQAMILSPHGAGVEGIGQAAAYGQKTWGTLIAPTNRRPYGFDWEDWGRLDALEVLADAKKIYQPDESKIYLSGHSMGGHGTWILGNQFPDQFAAIGPCAGWINFWSYGGALQIQNPDPVEAMLLRATNVSNPLLTINNYAPLGVFTLHGAADDTVPVQQARDMQEKLKGIVTSLSGHEEPGQGHWFDTDPDPGANCVDYAPMFDFFLRHRRKPMEEVRRVDFATCSPGVTAKSNWAEIVMQDTIGEPSRVQLDLSPATKTLTGTTENVRVLRLNLEHLGFKREGENLALTRGQDELILDLDGTKGKVPMLASSGILTLVKSAGVWSSNIWTAANKNPDRYGWFKSAFNHRFILVYGTAGTPEENRASLGRANFDSQTWFYRANGDCEVVSDKELAAMDHQGRSVILYGNRNSLRCWDDLVLTQQITVNRDGVRLGDKSWTGKDLGVLFCVPKPREAKAMVGVVGFTGNAGMVLTSSWPYFLAGVHIPDVMVAKASMLTDGSKSVLATGFWGEDWTLKNAQMTYR